MRNAPGCRRHTRMRRMMFSSERAKKIPRYPSWPQIAATRAATHGQGHVRGDHEKTTATYIASTAAGWRCTLARTLTTHGCHESRTCAHRLRACQCSDASLGGQATTCGSSTRKGRRCTCECECACVSLSGGRRAMQIPAMRRQIPTQIRCAEISQSESSSRALHLPCPISACAAGSVQQGPATSCIRECSLCLGVARQKTRALSREPRSEDPEFFEFAARRDAAAKAQIPGRALAEEAVAGSCSCSGSDSVASSSELGQKQTPRSPIARTGLRLLALAARVPTIAGVADADAGRGPCPAELHEHRVRPPRRTQRTAQGPDSAEQDSAEQDSVG